jgi:hypothetical protein
MVSGSGHASSTGSSGHHNVIVGDHTPRQGGMERNLFATLANQIGGQHLVKSFLSGMQSAHFEGHALSYLAPYHNVSTHDGNTQIGMHGGLTTIDLQGVTTLRAAEFTTKQ